MSALIEHFSMQDREEYERPYRVSGWEEIPVPEGWKIVDGAHAPRAARYSDNSWAVQMMIEPIQGPPVYPILLFQIPSKFPVHADHIYEQIPLYMIVQHTEVTKDGRFLLHEPIPLIA